MADRYDDDDDGCVSWYSPVQLVSQSLSDFGT